MKGKTASGDLEMVFQEILEKGRRFDEASRELMERAYAFASRAHKGQSRLSGKPFIIHGLEVARILVELGLDPPTVAAGLLHDVVEDTGVEVKDIEREFGKEIAELVEGLTELRRFTFHSPEERQVESARRMLISMAKDIRVIFIKLADRLHNMRTLEHLPEDRIANISNETLEIYAPLAHRLGAGKVESELEDLSFRFLEPERYNDISKLVRERAADHEEMFKRFRIPIERGLRDAGIDAKIISRVKHLYSVWRKMVTKQVRIDDIFDILSMRIVTKSVRDCYHALEIVHGLFGPMHARFRDYIAAPKANMYQSIHTTVMDETGRKMEVQIRTELMNNTAEYGIAAHWMYKERDKASASWDSWLEWIRQAIDYQLELTETSEFMQYLKTDIFQNNIYVFTPTGELKQLPAGSTPIDFAYMVHSDVGNRCSAARVNGKLVPLDCVLKSGDKVEILTSMKAAPNDKWLGSVRTSRARAKIRQWLRAETREEEAAAGRDILRKELRKRKLVFPKENLLRNVASELGRDSPGMLYSDVFRAKITPGQIIEKLYPGGDAEPAREDDVQFDRLRELVRKPIKGIRIDGMDNILVQFAKCCQPVPGDPIVGVITRGRGISVHRANCRNIKSIDEQGRLIGVEWDAYPDQKFLLSLIVTARDRVGLVAEISRRVKDLDTDVRSGHFEIHEGVFSLVLVVGISDLGHLNRVVSEIKGIDSVLSVRRAV